jgi:predicted dehydrogenase
MENNNKISRRSFLKNSALVGGALGTVSVGSAVFLGACKEKEIVPMYYTPLKEPGTYYVPELPDKAADGQELKAGVIGCGGRASGAAFDFLNAANGVTIVALADLFKDRVDGLAERLKNDKNIIIPEEKRFVGLDAYQQLIDSNVDVVIIATPPLFRPIHFKYAVEKGKHAFLEKPLAVDSIGYRSIVVTAKQAAAKNLAVVTGNQRRNERKYVESYKKIMEGYIGEITGGNVYWNQGMLWYNERKEGWSDVEWMIKDWVNWNWLSGDHIVEQHVHNIDVFIWFSGLRPVEAVGFGSRQRRVTGDQYDNFSVDFKMENGIHLHSMCRQIDGCSNEVGEFIQGTKGSWSSDGEIKDLEGNLIWKYDSDAEKEQYQQTNPYVLEHVNWINHIRAKKPLDMASELVVSNLAGIMGRNSAYTGKKVTWDEISASPEDYTPADLTLDKIMDVESFHVPVPGKGK